MGAKWQQWPSGPALIRRIHTSSSHHAPHQCSDYANNHGSSIGSREKSTRIAGIQVFPPPLARLLFESEELTMREDLANEQGHFLRIARAPEAIARISEVQPATKLARCPVSCLPLRSARKDKVEPPFKVSSSGCGPSREPGSSRCLAPCQSFGTSRERCRRHGNR